MGPHHSSLLALVLCLGQTIHMQEGLLPKPSIRAEPGPVIPRGQPVTIVCRSPAGADTFHLLEKENPFGFGDQKMSYHHGSQGSEARFHIDVVSDVTAGRYSCSYSKGSSWSEHSEPLELKVADEVGSTPPSGTTPEVTPPPTGLGSQTGPDSWNYRVGNYVRIGLAGVVLLILVAILADAGHSRHRWPQDHRDGHKGSNTGEIRLQVPRRGCTRGPRLPLEPKRPRAMPVL